MKIELTAENAAALAQYAALAGHRPPPGKVICAGLSLNMALKRKIGGVSLYPLASNIAAAQSKRVCGNSGAFRFWRFQPAIHPRNPGVGRVKGNRKGRDHGG